MKRKQMILAGLTALFVAGGAGLANAESGLSSAASDEGSSAAMQAEGTAGYAAGMNARGQVLVHRHRHTVMRHHYY
jgi:hypothetical protein